MTTCFVIGPIGQKYADAGSPQRASYESALELYETVIAAACLQSGLEPVRADQISVTGDITDQIFKRLYESDVVIADLSGGNPNVMYELGLRHSLGKLTIPIADVDTPLPFDVSSLRTILVKRTELGLIQARDQLIKAIRLGLENGPDPVAATRIWDAAQRGEVDDIAALLAVSTRDKVETTPEEEAGFLESMVEMQEALPRLVAIAERISLQMVEVNAVTDIWSRRISESNESDAPLRQRLALVDGYAKDLEGASGEFKELASSFKSEIVGLDGNVRPLLRYVAETEKLAEDEGTKVFLGVLEQLAQSSRDGLEGLTFFAGAARQLGGISSKLRRPASTIAGAVALMTDALAVIEDWDFAARQILEHSSLPQKQAN